MEENPKPKTLRGGRRRRRMVTTWSDTLGDLIPEILSRLPVKSVLRFRCVSKSWYALISDPNFIDMHLRNRTSANNNGYVLVKHESVNFYGDMFWLYYQEIFIKHKRLELPFNRSYGHFEVVGYCNGILCLSSDGITYNMGDIYLWNPSIQKFKALPPSLKLCSTLVHMFYTFSFVPQINDYKVIKFVYDTYDKIPRRGCIVKLPPKVEVYSLRLNSWKEIQNVVPCVILYNSIYTFVNGVVHWVATMNMEENCNYEFILTFDMVTDVFGEMKLPECCRDVCVVDKAPTVLNKSLCLFVFSRKGENEQVDIWVMKEYGATESWTKQFTFDQWVHFLSPLGFMKNGEVVLLGDDEELVSYDPRVEQVEKLRIYGVPRLLDVFTYYTESLVLLNERN